MHISPVAKFSVFLLLYFFTLSSIPYTGSMNEYTIHCHRLVQVTQRHTRGRYPWYFKRQSSTYYFNMTTTTTTTVFLLLCLFFMCDAARYQERGKTRWNEIQLLIPTRIYGYIFVTKFFCIYIFWRYKHTHKNALNIPPNEQPTKKSLSYNELL